MTINPAMRLVVLFAVLACAPLPVTNHSSDTKTLHHYVFFGQDREEIPLDTAFLAMRQFEGAQVAYTWRMLEPSKDVYDFKAIREDIALLFAHGKKLFIQLQDVSFSPARINVPQYLLQDSVYHGGAAKQYSVPDNDEPHAVHEGWVARRWDPAVQERLHKLFAALGREFDDRIEGINLAESSVGFGYSGKLYPAGYSPAVYRDALITNMRALKRAFPKSVAMQYGNFMPGEWRATNDKGYLSSLYAAARESRIAMGGPDLLPFSRPQLLSSYPLIREVADAVPTGLAVQDGNMAEINPSTGKPVTPDDLVAFASDYLRLDHIFWGREEPFYSAKIIPYLRTHLQ